MLFPIDTAAVIRDGGAVGRSPADLHEAVAWWLGACHVATQRTSVMAVAHDGHPVSRRFADSLLSGAINAEHYACLVRDLGIQSEETLVQALTAGAIPGAYLTADGEATNCLIRITLYDRRAVPVDEETGLAEVRRRIAEDRVPIPVNARSKGRVVRTLGDHGEEATP
ncbi:hypothetical protein [Streptomyces fradiae]